MEMHMSAPMGAELNLNTWLRMRETGQKVPLGYGNKFSKFLYSSILPYSSWEQREGMRGVNHGGVFNLEFSPDGSLLVAACERKSFLMFDSLSQKKVHAVEDAHGDCVNCVRFLDSRTFVTCSDDSTVALWDARNLKSSIRILRGHSNWVKNIEYSQNDGLLVTSGFDGSIYTWDINSYTENGFTYERVFHTNGLMRTRLTPDSSKMVICTTGGYLMIIHDLNLRTLAQDLYGFKPNMYRLMQQSQTTIPSASLFTSLFSKKRKRNRIEFVSDFPVHNDAEVVSSLQIHPQGWCALSRNISHEELSEWTCVHDIQDKDDDDLSENEDVSAAFRDDNDDDGMYEEDDANNDRRGFRGFPNPNYNSESESDGDADPEWLDRRMPPSRSARTSMRETSGRVADGSDSSSSSDSETVNPRRGRVQQNSTQAPVGRFHALLEITRFSSTTTRLLNDSSPLFRESPNSSINNNSSSLPSRRPANRTSAEGQEVNSNPVHRRGGNLRRLRITVDGQVQVSDDDSSGEPASNVRVMEAQETNRVAGSSRSSAGRQRPRFRLAPNSGHSARTSSMESRRSTTSSTSPNYNVSQRIASARSYLRNAEQRYQRLRNSVSSAISSISNEGTSSLVTSRSSPRASTSSNAPLSRSGQPSTQSSSTSSLPSSLSSTAVSSMSSSTESSSRRSSQSSGQSSAQSSSQSSAENHLGGSIRSSTESSTPSSTQNSAQNSALSFSQSFSQSSSPNLPRSVSLEASAVATQSSSQRVPSSPSQNESRNSAQADPSVSPPNANVGANPTANAAAAVGAARQGRGGPVNSPFSQNMELHVASADVWEALVVIREARARRQQARNPSSVRDRRDLISRFLRRLHDVNDAQRTIENISATGSSPNNASSTGGNRNVENASGSTPAAGRSNLEAGSSSSLPDRPRHVLRISRSRQPHRQGQAPAAIALGHFLQNPTPATRTLVMIAPHQGGAQNIHLRVSPNSYSYQSQQLKIPRNHKIHQNTRRLSHYIEEPNVGKGFIKELCFSSDGRIMCSPFSYGIRLLAFTPDCQEISTSLPPEPPVRLYEVSERMCHEDYVVSSKFSPTHCLLVSGCLKGKIVWHQPYL